MSMYQNLDRAIARSISHSEIVRVHIAGGDAVEVIRELRVLSDPENLEYVNESKTLIDVWGTVSGECFRIKVYTRHGNDE